MTNEDVSDNVMVFIHQHTKASRTSLSSSTQLARDLGMDGADAHEFMEAFAQKFKVDMSQFEFADHFGPEGVDPLALFKRQEKLQPIAIADLIEAVHSKTWVRKKASAES